MNTLKKFLEKKKVDKKFKHAGQGYSLAGGAAGSSQSGGAVQPKSQSQGYKPPEDTANRRIVADAAAEAAARRLQPEPGLTAAQRRIREQARKELEEEQRRAREQEGGPNVPEDPRDGVQNFEHSDQISSVLFTCDLFSSETVLPKKQMVQAVEAYLREMYNEEPTEAAIIMIWSLNNEDKVSQAIPILLKYLNNIISAPEDPKFRRIRTSNKVFMEKIAAVKGGVDFLKSIGFKEEFQNNEYNSVDAFLVLPEPNESTLELLESAASSLDNGAKITLKLYRDPKVYRIDPSKPVPKAEVPQDFYVRSAEELRREQQKRAEEVDKLTTLRTSKMRENDAKLRQYNYRYTIIRIRFPNHYVLQGVFNVYENFGTIREFVESNIGAMLGEFTFADPVSNNARFDDDNKSFADYGLAPAALLHFDWDNGTLASLNHASQRPVYLSPEVESKAEVL